MGKRRTYVRTTPSSWSGQRRSFPTKIRDAILNRDRICVTCGQQPSVIADHKRAHAECRALGIEPDTMDNGQGLCQPCSDEKTEREKREGRARVRYVKRAEPHPGIRT